jgi:ATP-binding cassette subfamily C protein
MMVRRIAHVIRQLLALMSRRQRLWFGGLVVMTLLGTSLELLSLALVVPFVSLLQGADVGMAQWPLNVLAGWLGPVEPDRFVAVAGLMLVGVFLLKNLYLTALAYVRSRFIFNLHNRLAVRLFRIYVTAPYGAHISRNSAKLVRNVINGVDQLVSELVLHFTRLGTDTFLIIATVSFLLLSDPTLGLVVFTFMALLVGSYDRVVRHQIKADGLRRQIEVASMIQQVNEGLGGFKLAKLFHCEEHFIDKYNSHSLAYTAARRRLTFLSDVPRYYVESIGLVAIVAAIIGIMTLRDNSGSIVPLLSLYAVGAFKLFPAINRWLTSLNKVQANLPVLDLISEDLAAEAAPAPQRSLPAREPASGGEIELDGVWCRYPGAATAALRGVSLKVGEGKVIGLVGASGAGKTTLVDVLMGLLPIEAGDVRFDGRSIYDSLEDWQRRIGYIPQSIFLSDSDVTSNVAFGVPSEEVDERMVWRALETAQLAEFVRSLPDGLATVVGENGIKFSGGQRQRIGIARALYRDPQVIVMDEATAALDNRTEHDMMAAVLRLGGEKTLIIVAHRLTTVERCSQLYILKGGEVVGQGTYEELRRSSRHFREIAPHLDREPA